MSPYRCGRWLGVDGGKRVAPVPCHGCRHICPRKPVRSPRVECMVERLPCKGVGDTGGEGKKEEWEWEEEVQPSAGKHTIQVSFKAITIHCIMLY